MNTRESSTICYLSVLVKGSPVELVGVREALGPGALPDRDQPVLVWVQHSPLLPHWLRVGDRC